MIADGERGSPVARVASPAAAYLVTAAAMLVSVVWLRRILPPAQLRSALGFFFIAALSAGLEPATVKARALLSAGAPDARAVATASAIKALAATPILALVWKLADPDLPAAALAWLVPTVVAGFWATDFRVLLDLQGRHGAAIWLKQGSLALAFLGAALGLAAGLPIGFALALATAPRLILPLAVARGARRRQPKSTTATALWRDGGWVAMALTSALAAGGGSIDRLLGLRLLPAEIFAGYYLLYEFMSRFWVLPYLATPVLFARLAGGRESEALKRSLWVGCLLAGAGLVAAAAAVVAGAPRTLGALLRFSPGWSAVAFAVAIVLAALTQLRIAELQGQGAVRRAAAVVGGGAVLSLALFWTFVHRWGVDGLLWAWLIKSVAELAAAMAAGPRREEANAALAKLP